MRSTSSSSSADFGEWLRLGAYDALAEAYPDGADIGVLLTSLGADLTRLRPFGQLAPRLYWAEVGRRVCQGAFAFDMTGLLRAASAEHPGNERLARLAATMTPDGVRVLLLQAAPLDQARMRLNAEHSEIRAVAVRHPGALELGVSPATRADDLVSEVLNFRPTVVHFAGHGADDGRGLVFEDDFGLGRAVGMEQIAAAVGLAAPLAAVVLSSCYTGTSAGLLSAYAKVVVGSTTALGDHCAIAFTRGFYTALATGLDGRRAFDAGVAQARIVGCSADGLLLLEGAGA